MSNKGLLIKASFLFIILAGILVLSSFFAEATVIGANKGVITFKNVLKNGYAQEPITLTTDTDFNLSVTYKIEGDIADWIRIEPAEQPFFISRTSQNTVLVIIEPPEDAKNQRYSASIRFLTGALAGPEGQFGTAVRAAINIRLGVDITGQEIVACRAGGFEMEDVEEGYPLEFYAIFTNDGNVRLRPNFVLEFWNQDQTELVKTFNLTLNESILPTVQKKVFFQINNNLKIGQYWVKIRAPSCGEGDVGFITVSVIERGGVSDKGELIEIDNAVWAKVGDIVPIDAVFKNLGSRVVSAKFKGTVTSGENIFKVIDTDPLDVMPGETVRIRTYFNPVQEGQYMITGRVLYNKKLTFEKSSVLNVNPSGKPPSGQGIGWVTILAILVVAIIILLILIIRKKKNLNLLQRHKPGFR
ncbi:hypothetical protein JW756_05655 [Candidatus Woesearchaeota archaeon]|nr:hypothetical protein [Candidatus Woesearchaeota archaeon]